jgi:hypothetical protein
MTLARKPMPPARAKPRRDTGCPECARRRRVDADRQQRRRARLKKAVEAQR